MTTNLRPKAKGCRRLLALLAVVGVTAFAADGDGASITATTKSVPGLSPPAQTFLNTIRITGIIERGDSDQLRETLTKLSARTSRTGEAPLATAELSSLGGDLVEGMKMGRLFREFEIATVVRKSDSCLSACALAFLGGSRGRLPANVMPDRHIELGGQVGFHNFSINPGLLQNNAQRPESMREGFELGRAGSAMIVSYAAELGIDQLFVAELLRLPADRFEYIDTTAKFLMLQTCLSEPVKSQIPAQRQAVNICNHATGSLTQAAGLQVASLTVRQAKLQLLEYVQRNVEGLKVGPRLASQLRAVIASRDSSLIESTYAGLKAAGVPLPELAGSVYQISGYSAGLSQMDCVVSFSMDDPDTYDVVITGPNGLAPAFRTAPRNCRWLFRHDRDDVLNPVR